MFILLDHVKIQLIINGIDFNVFLLILLITSEKKLLNLEFLIYCFIQKYKSIKLIYFLSTIKILV
jgi:hypothetical protein